MPTVLYDVAGNYDWPRPPGVTKVTRKAGGSAGGGGGNAGGGGGGGEFRQKDLSGLTAASYNLTIGSPGSGGIGSDDGTDGGDTYWGDGSEFIAKGGLGGKSGDNGGSGGAGGSGGIGSVGYSGGSGGNGADSAGGGGGGAAQDTFAGANGNDGSGGVGGSGGGGSAGGGGDSGVDGGDSGSDSVLAAAGAGGGGSGSNGGNCHHDGKLSLDYSLGTLECTIQPGSVASGDSNTAAFQIKDVDGSVDTNADTAGAGSTVTISLLTISGSGSLGGTSNANYATGVASFGFNVSGGGTFKIRATDDATGVFFDSNAFTITAGAAFPGAFLFRRIRRKKARPYQFASNAVRHVIIPTGTRPVPISHSRRVLVPVQRTKRAVVPINSVVTLTTLLPIPAKMKRAVELRCQKRTAIVPGATSERPIPLQRFRGQRVETRRQSRCVPLPGKQTTPVVLTKIKSQAPTTRRQRGVATVPTLSQATLLPLPGKTRTKIVERGRKVRSQFPAPLRNVPILMPARRRLIEITRRQRGVVPLALRMPGLPIVVQRIKGQRPEVRTQKRFLPLTLPARQTPVMVRSHSRGGAETRRQRTIVNVGMKTTSALPVIVARRQAGAAAGSNVRVKFRTVPVSAIRTGVVLPAKKQRSIETRTIRRLAGFPAGQMASGAMVIIRRGTRGQGDKGTRVKLRPVPAATAATVVLPGRKQRSSETRTVRKMTRFPGTGVAAGGLVVSRKVNRSQGPVASKTKLRPLPVASPTASMPVVVSRRRATQTIVVRRSAVRIVPAGAGAKSIVVQTTKKTW